MADVYWALSEIYLDDARQVQETVRLARATASSAPLLPTVPHDPSISEAHMSEYSSGGNDHFKYVLLSESGAGPIVKTLVAPDLPEELIEEHASGTVEMDVQLTETGDVGGVWLISSTPEVLSSVATAVIREWKFDAGAGGKIRVVFQFLP